MEFIIVSSSIIFFIFMFINLCYVFLATQYIDYAVYMAARSMFAAHANEDAQKNMAVVTLARMLKMPLTGEGAGIFGPLVTFKTGARDAVQATATYPNPRTGDNTVQGVRLEYEVPVFLIPPLGLLKQEDLRGISRMRLVSETYMDREPSQDECYDYLLDFLNRHFGHIPAQFRRGIMHAEMSDNGC